MILDSTNFKDPAARASGLLQQAVCATSVDELMRRADAARVAYYADYRKGIIAACGEVTK